MRFTPLVPRRGFYALFKQCQRGDALSSSTSYSGSVISPASCSCCLPTSMASKRACSLPISSLRSVLPTRLTLRPRALLARTGIFSYTVESINYAKVCSDTTNWCNEKRKGCLYTSTRSFEFRWKVVT